MDINAEVITIGTEILLGEITDTNSVFIARLLRDIGLNLYYMSSVGDNERRIADVIRVALSRAQVVITCGGLGPTVDDMTRQSVASATDRDLIFHQELLDKIAERFGTFRMQMSDNNRRQAYLPENAIVIENPVGTAPSFIVEHAESVVISLPGVPREMKYLMTEQVVPYLRERYGLGTGIIKARVLRTAGIGESTLDNQIGVELLQQSNPTVGLAAHSGQVDVRITAKAKSEAEADDMIAEVEAKLRSKIDRYIYGIDDEKIEDVLIQLLLATDRKLAISETGIGNPLRQKIQVAPHGDRILAGSETYLMPADLCHALSADAESGLRELAEHAARTVCKQNNTKIGIAVVSQPGMDEHHSDDENGTAIAVCVNDKIRSRVYGFGAQSELASDWTYTWSLSILWQMLQEKPD